MFKDSIVIGIDIGSSNIKTIIAKDLGEDYPRVIGVNTTPTFGIRRGSIVDPEEVTKSIRESVEKSERMAGLKAKRAVVSIGGAEINFQEAKGVIAIGRADGEVTENDIQRVLVEVQNSPLPLNREIIHIVPRNYRLDDQTNIKDPVGMKGVRLEADAILIESGSTHIKNIFKCFEFLDIEIGDIVLEPLAAARAALGKKQKELGVILINLGGGTTSIAVFEEGELLHTAILPVGAGHITNDIAIGLRSSIDVAEKVKIKYGTALSEEVSKKEEIDLSQIDSSEDGLVMRHHVAEIIEARLEEIFKMTNKELNTIKRAGLLPAGAVLVGGGAKLPGVVEIAKKILGLPIQIGYPTRLGGIANEVDDPSFVTAVGLVLWAFEQKTYQTGVFTGIKAFDKLSKGAEYTASKMKKWLGRFMP